MEDFAITWPVYMVVRGMESPTKFYGPLTANFGDAERKLWCVPIFTDTDQVDRWLAANADVVVGQVVRLVLTDRAHLADVLGKVDQTKEATHVVFDPRPDTSQGFICAISEIIEKWKAGSK